VHVCPVCSAKIARHRKEELHAILDAALERGHAVSMLTLTQRHHAGQSLEYLWGSLSYAWNLTASGRGWSDFKTQLGLIGYIKAVEVTHGKNGWHVHQHVLIISEKNPEITPIFRQRKQGRRKTPYPVEVVMPAAFIGERWGRALKRKKLDFLQDRGGLDWRTAKPGEAQALGDYVAKLGGASSAAKRAKTAEGVAKEATLGAFKKAKRGNRTPFQILADIGMMGDVEDIEIWEEYEQASKGKRAMSWSKGIRDWAGLGEELSDEEIAEQEEGDGEIFNVDRTTWRRQVYPFAAYLLDLVEQKGVDAVYAWLDQRKIRYVVPPPPD
jgi:hypothetical protein